MVPRKDKWIHIHRQVKQKTQQSSSIPLSFQNFVTKIKSAFPVLTEMRTTLQYLEIFYEYKIMGGILRILNVFQLHLLNIQVTSGLR